MGTTTPNLSLYKPDVGEVNWGTLINGNWNTLDATTSGSAFGVSSVRNLFGINTPAFQFTRYDMSVDSLVLRNPSTGLIVARGASGTLTCNLGVNGANGLDTGSISPNTWYQFYFIWNGTTLATLASIGLPPTGPTLMPAGYTYWALAAAIRANASGQLVQTWARGAEMFYDQAELVQSQTPDNNVFHSVSVASTVPPNAITFLLDVSLSAPNNTTWTGIYRHRLAANTGDVSRLELIAAATTYMQFSARIIMPQVSQSYVWSYEVFQGSLTGGAMVEFVVGYRIPNGDA